MVADVWLQQFKSDLYNFISLGKPSKKNGESWESVPTEGGGLPESQPLNRFLKNTQNALKCIINT